MLFFFQNGEENSGYNFEHVLIHIDMREYMKICFYIRGTSGKFIRSYNVLCWLCMFQKMTILVTFFLSCSVFIGMSKCKFHVSDYKTKLAKFLLILNEFQRLKSTKMILNRFLSWCVREVPRLWRVQRWGQHSDREHLLHKGLRRRQILL